MGVPVLPHLPISVRGDAAHLRAGFGNAVGAGDRAFPDSLPLVSGEPESMVSIRRPVAVGGVKFLRPAADSDAKRLQVRHSVQDQTIG